MVDISQRELYEEYSNRINWDMGRKLRYWIAKSTLKSIASDLTIDYADIELLEFGCGDGLMGEVALALGAKGYTGIEPTPELAQSAQRRLGDKQILETPLPNVDHSLENRFDLVLAVMVLEHAGSPIEASQWMRAMSTCLNEAGNLVIVCPDYFSYGHYFWDIDWSHSFPTTQERLEQIAKGLNLRVLDSTRIRAGTSQLWIRALLSICSKLIPTQLLDALGSIAIGRRLGRGVQAGLLWSSVRIVVAK